MQSKKAGCECANDEFSDEDEREKKSLLLGAGKEETLSTQEKTLHGLCTSSQKYGLLFFPEVVEKLRSVCVFPTSAAGGLSEVRFQSVFRKSIPTRDD